MRRETLDLILSAEIETDLLDMRAKRPVLGIDTWHHFRECIGQGSCTLEHRIPAAIPFCFLY